MAASGRLTRHPYRYTLGTLTVILALMAAALYGSGVALQYREATKMPDSESVHLGLLVRLVKQPLWVLGVVFDFAGFALQAVALARGSLVVVEPLIASSLIFSFITVALLNGKQPERHEIGAALLVVGGLSTFLIVGAPDVTSHDAAPTAKWLITAAVLWGLVGLIAAFAVRRSQRVRGAALAVAAGLANGFVAVASKAFAQKIDDDSFLAALASWQPYLLLFAGISAVLLLQSAYQAGTATVTFPLVEVTAPLSAAIVGVAVFGEHLSLHGHRGPIVVLALAVMIWGMVLLGREEPMVPPHPAIQ
ncbi:MAG TPA: DMT family transporter [Acidimicrobiales bacterium]|nr:DMT family transporter [Acidimicrobiales bacterium]